jgi:hypothetical protein
MARPENDPKRSSLSRRVAQEGKVHAQAAQAARRAQRRTRARYDKIIIGPWSSEVGFELLYWIPFVRRLLRANGVAPERVVAISRGGVGSWYADLASEYVDLLDHVSPQRIAEEQAERVARGGQKHMRISEFDREMLGLATGAAGFRGGSVVHPSLMYRRYRAVWMRRRPVAVAEREMTFAPLDVEPRAPDGLDIGRYIAVKAYFSDCFPRTAENEQWLVGLLTRLAARMPVVLLRGALALDDHEDAVLGSIAGVRAMPRPSPSTNLAEQGAVVRGADMLVATYGGFSYLGPLLGVPVCAYYSHEKFNTVHLDLLRGMLQRLRRQAADDARIELMLFDTHHLGLIDKLGTS